jgi:hypothetical protein
VHYNEALSREIALIHKRLDSLERELGRKRGTMTNEDPSGPPFVPDVGIEQGSAEQALND